MEWADQVELSGCLGGELLDVTSGKAEEVSCFGCGDVLELGQMIENGTNPQRESQLLVQVEGTANNAQHRGNRAEVRVVDIAKERNFLTVLFVFLCPPTNADGGEGGQGCIGDVMDGDFSIEEELKVLHDESFGGCKGQAVIRL